MKTIVSIIMMTMLFVGQSFSQDKFYTKEGTIYFNCSGGLATIEATNKSAVCVLDTKTGQIQFSTKLKEFKFELSLMEEHFNENYVESDKYPVSTFSGVIQNNSLINYSKDGVYPVKVGGKFTLHGVTKDIVTSGQVTVKKGSIFVSSDFIVHLSDYKISVPNLVIDKVSNDAKINVKGQLVVLKN